MSGSFHIFTFSYLNTFSYINAFSHLNTFSKRNTIHISKHFNISIHFQILIHFQKLNTFSHLITLSPHRNVISFYFVLVWCIKRTPAKSIGNSFALQPAILKSWIFQYFLSKRISLWGLHLPHPFIGRVACAHKFIFNTYFGGKAQDTWNRTGVKKWLFLKFVRRLYLTWYSFPNDWSTCLLHTATVRHIAWTLCFQCNYCIMYRALSLFFLVGGCPPPHTYFCCFKSKMENSDIFGWRAIFFPLGLILLPTFSEYTTTKYWVEINTICKLYTPLLMGEGVLYDSQICTQLQAMNRPEGSVHYLWGLRAITIFSPILSFGA